MELPAGDYRGGELKMKMKLNVEIPEPFTRKNNPQYNYGYVVSFLLRFLEECVPTAEILCEEMNPMKLRSMYAIRAKALNLPVQVILRGDRVFLKRMDVLRGELK
jgi:hypothetical protein